MDPLDLVLVPLLAALNRVRGGGFYADRLPGHPRFYVAPLVALLALDVVPAREAIGFGVAYLMWCWPPWGFLMCLGNWTPEGRPISWIEEELLRFTRGRFGPALMLRHMLGVWPGFVAVFYLDGPIWLPVSAVLFGALVWAFYAAAWRWRPSAPIEAAELATGALWGALLVSAGAFP